MMFGRSHSKLGFEFIALAIITACSSLSTSDVSSTLEPTPPPSSTPTSIPLPAYMEYQLPSVVFSLENANTVPPEDIISEVYFNVAGGGGGKQGNCFDIGSDYPVANIYNQKSVEDKVDLLEPLELVVCGWMPDEQVEVNVTTPTGNTITTLLTAQQGILLIPVEGDAPRGEIIYYSEYIYYPLIDSPAGEYIFTFTGDNGGIVTYTINYVEPVLPMAYIIDFRDDDMTKKNTNIDMNAIKDNLPLLVLSGYTPKERVRLFSYDGGLFKAWEDYQVDQNGRLLIQLNEVGTTVVVGGAPAIEIHPPYYPAIFDMYVDRLDPIYLTCKDTIPTRLKIGEYAYVSTSTSLSNRLRSEPTTSATMVDKLAPRTVMEIVDGPECADGILWWSVKGVTRDFEGWTGEGDTEYWLVPCYSKDYC